ncbi:MAG: transcriptional regulator, partial [Salinispira sp.]
PPIQLYEIGGVYFVRDGNHRVSVARSQGVEMIDAEVIQLNSIITITPKMDKIELMEAVIGYEKERFEQKTKFSTLISDYSLNFTSTGRYNEVLFHILEHKYYLNEDYDYELSLDIAVISWFNNVYMPIIEVIKNYNLLIHFPDRTEGDLYVWIAKHWHTLKEKYGENIEIHQAASDIVQSKGMKPLQVMRYYLRKIFCGKHTHE